jgi:hypothetical protein
MKELSLHILDVARNSVEAGATELTITLVEDYDADRLDMILEDNGRGMSADDLRQATDAFFTTRTTRKVGLGLAMLQATCERCEGGLEISSEPGRGTVVRSWLRLGNIDRPPLGDMGGVVQALACEPAIALVYRHSVLSARERAHKSFELDTREIQQELGDVALTSPPVLDWLRGHVKEGLRELGSRA